ncbi:hypothetical protein CCAX7_61690 [Capsulimonas corticalis]|uniref:Uncharacterized protein n=1 Tax=Capsulimonas corticalis TaxID=2219043 RepID=A0A402CWA5_9BACT|nr:hypothetical protein CCAX7_61690 [Capsulimonas corticalis]
MSMEHHKPEHQSGPSHQHVEAGFEERIKGLELYPAGELTLTVVLPGEEGAFTADSAAEAQDVADRREGTVE